MVLRATPNFRILKGPQFPFRGLVSTSPLEHCHLSSVRLNPLARAMASLNYPPAHRGDVVDDVNGTQVPDPYRWLEEPKSDETKVRVLVQSH